MADLDVAGLSDSVLKTWMNQYMTMFINAQIEGKEESVKATLLKGFNDCKAELESREAKMEAPTTVVFSQIEQLQLKDMRSYFDTVSTFGPGVACPIFVSQIENGYKMHVGSNSKFESSFVRQVKTKLCQAYLSQVNESSQTLNTWSELKSFLKKQHASKDTIFQLIDEPWNMELTGSIADFSVDLENSINKAMVSVEDKYADANKTLDAKAMFNLIGGYLMLRQIRQRFPDAFNNTVTQLDNCYNISDVVEKVRAFTDRVGGEESANSSAFHTARGDHHKRGGGQGGKKGGNKNGSKVKGRGGGGAKGDNKFGKNKCYNTRDYGQCKRPNCPYDDCVSKTNAAAGGDGGGAGGASNTGFFSSDFQNQSLAGARK